MNAINPSFLDQAMASTARPVDPVVPAFPTYIDSTMLAAFRSCPRAFFNEFVLGLRPPGRNWDLHAGAAWASAMDATRKVLLDNRNATVYSPEEWTQTALEQGLITLTLEYGPENPEKPNKTWLNLYSAFERYWQHFGWPEGHGTDPYRLRGSEFSFAVPLPIKHPVSGDPICYVGRLDAIVERDGLYFALDDKTTSQLGPSWVDKWAMRGQLFGYTWAAREHGYPCVGAVVRGTGLYANGADFLQYEGCYFNSPWLIDQWYEDMLASVVTMAYGYLQFLEAGLASRRFNRVWNDACASYSGCSYLPLCQTPDARQSLKYDLYVVNRWDPLAREPLPFEEAQCPPLS